MLINTQENPFEMGVVASNDVLPLSMDVMAPFISINQRVNSLLLHSPTISH